MLMLPLSQTSELRSHDGSVVVAALLFRKIILTAMNFDAEPSDHLAGSKRRRARASDVDGDRAAARDDPEDEDGDGIINCESDSDDDDDDVDDDDSAIGAERDDGDDALFFLRP